MKTEKIRTNYDRLIALWILRCLSPALGRSSFFIGGSYADNDVAYYLGLPRCHNEKTMHDATRMMDEMQISLERGNRAKLPARAETNFKLFADALKLNPTEKLILEFFACLTLESPLIDTAHLIQRLIETEPARVLEKVLNLQPYAVAKAMASDGRLMRCGLLKREERSMRSPKFCIFSKHLANLLLRDSYDPAKVMKTLGVVTPPPPELDMKDFTHVQKTLDLLLVYLKSATAKRKKGVNVLIHGSSGTGKSQLTRVLAKALTLPVFELDTADKGGNPLSATQRLSVLNMAQMQIDPSSLLVFDEAEDILTQTTTDRGAANTHKGWFNLMLERNRQPVFWISNSIDSLDPAFSRRFDFVLHLPIPPKAHRLKILEKKAGKLISEGLIEKLSELECLAPAVISRACNVVRSIRKEIPKQGRDDAFTNIISGVLKAQGHPDPAMTAIQRVPHEIYDIKHLNTSADLQRIAENLKNRPSARICLYGPSGSGKTSFGHWIAREIGQPLISQKASDFLRPYVGATEQKIAQTFERARQEGAVLLIDEVDSFLRDRAHARQSWEVTKINEMLTQMESFYGVLIASTNLIDQLDAASMRRFDIKLHFGYMLPEQIRRMLRAYCQSMNLPAPSHSDMDLAAAMDCAAPGDFAAAARRHRFEPFPDSHSFISAVADECDYKSSRARKIGFN
jgi:SpoVK/Ycf46/Vps4 family AAA+-type ATPase